jgi:two-component system, NtrC family, sensor kinase
MSSRVDKLSSTFARITVPARHGETLKAAALAHWLPGAAQLIHGSLRSKFIIVIVSLQIAMMAAVIVIVERYQREAIIEQARLRALALGTSLAALGEGYLLTYDFTKLEQAAEKLTTEEQDVAYTVAHLHDGRVAVFSGRDDLQGERLYDLISQRALQATAPLVQEILIPESLEPGYDVAIPVFIPGSPKKWGTVRVGFSLQRACWLIHQTRRALLLLGLGAIICGTSLAILMAMLIGRPIARLVTNVDAFTRGTYGRSITVEGHDEIGYLAYAFEQMRDSLQSYLANLAAEKRRLEETNQRLQETQQQLIQSERLAAVGQVAARVAHEVNNPLAIIKTAISIINHRQRDHNPAAEQLQMIEEEISRIARIIDELREFSRPIPTDEVVDVNHVIQGLAALLHVNLRQRQILLKVVLEPQLPSVRISADQLKQVILNIVRNGEDAMPEGGELTIRTARKGHLVECSITDTGCGIALEHRGRLFDPFFTTKGKERGMGLGLSVSDGIIRGANGRIDAESEIGKGTTFRVSLPICGDRQEG